MEQQIGTQFVDSVLHNSTFYTTLPGDPPERQHKVAKAHLDSGNPRRAEEILHSLLANGHTTTERAYLYVLSILSDRSFTEITAELSNEIHNAMSTASGLPRDEWRDALDVVDTLLRCAHAEFGDGTAAQELTGALGTFGTLTVDRQDEIDRHLNLILSGAVQERLTGERKYQIAVERMSGDRVERAWKFFEANPRQPMKWLTPPLRSTATDWRDSILGSVAMALAIVFLLVDGISATTVVGLALIAAGGYMALRYTTVWQTDVRRAESVGGNFQPPQPFEPETKFDTLVDQCFRQVAPGGLWEITAGYRAYLKRRLQHQFNDDEVHPGELKWLIMLHGVRARQQYDHPPAEPPEAHRASNLRIIGVMVWATGLAPLAVAGQFVAFFLAAGGWWGIRGIARIVSVSRAQSLLDHDAEVLLAEESAQYHRWVQVLADRPSDAEMAHWLALDKAYLKDDALRRANLRERDLVTHVVLTGRAPYARKGRVTNGPPRYEAYLVYIFLLTPYGMRTTRTYLSLATGDVRNEQRQMCTYDAVASASVVEKGVRTFLADGRPSVDNLSGRVFRLTLLNGTCIAEVKENPRPTGDHRTGEDDEPGDAASVQTSGFDSALQILEAVATEGREWIARDRERKQRWARNWCTRSSSGDDSGAGKNSGRIILR
ncbi:hypothetical protein [Nocardia sp. NPDC049526]|uniref:hypothetical protein n=1 Tax=Nocardia sp. NPDC049526 TaxID=3364316 RepID=UPI0037981FC9